MDIFSDNNRNTILLILIALLLLSGNNSFSLSGCTLPILIALGFCLFKNGTLSSLFTSSTCGCNN